METHRDIIDRWPTVVAFADQIGEDRNCVYGWYRRHSIPSEYWDRVAKAAGKIGCHEVTVDLLQDIAPRFAASVKRRAVQADSVASTNP